MSLGQPIHPDYPDYIQSTEYSGNCLLEIHCQTRCEAAFFVAPIYLTLLTTAWKILMISSNKFSIAVAA